MADFPARRVIRLFRIPWPKGIWPRLALLLLAALVPLLALLYVASTADGDRVMLTARRQVADAARLAADRQQAVLLNTAGVLRVLAQVPAVRDGGPEACATFLQSALPSLPGVSALSVTGPGGIVACATRPDSLGQDVHEQAYVSRAMAQADGGGFALGGVVASRAGQPASLAMAVGLPHAPGTPGGAMLAVLGLDLPAGMGALLPPSADRTVQLLDSGDGSVLARVPDASHLAGLRFPDHPVIKAFSAAQAAGTVSALDLEGTERLFGFAPLAGSSPVLLVAVGLSSEAIRTEADQRTRKAMLVGLGIVALAMLLSWWLAQRTLVTPMRALSAAAARLGSGDLSATAEIPDGVAWELRALASTFGRMAKRLQARDQRIEAMQEALAASEGHHRLLADSANDMITRFSSDLRRIYVSPACRDLLGYEPEELIGQETSQIVHPDDWEALNAALNQKLMAGQPRARAIYRALRKNGAEIWLESSGRALDDGEGFVVVDRDVTERMVLEERLAEANRQLRVLVGEDALTGLSNRRRFDEFLDEEYRRFTRSESPLAVAMIDVDRFKLYNDAYGHPAGDACLQAVAKAIDSVLRRPGDLSARYGGEEFAILMPFTAEAGAMIMAEKIQAAVRGLALPHSGSESGIVTISIGIAVIHPSACDGQPKALVQAADAALYRAKREGRDTVRITGYPPDQAA